ncbi:MAG: PBECR4 domain-containing protein, partial [Streptococcus gallolyticus]|nr:PBECR4 domain-containing protein [Streptococcus gallolyticus]
MPEKETRAKSRKERREVARSRAILDVANELNMDLFRSGRDYRWKEHHSLVISPDNNLWQWFSRHVGGDVISLVETIKEVNFNQAVDFLNDGDFKTFQRVERKEEPFNYYLNPYEQPFIEARNYLKHQRKLSDETIDFFLDQGVMAQANAKVHGSIEPVIVFKSLTQEGEIIGAQLQGIEANWKKWPERGYAKKIVNNSDGMTGLHVDIGQPKRLIFTESSIDLMSYYELHKDSLQDVRLVSMDGLKESIVGRHLVELEAELSGRPLRWNREELSRGLTTAIDNGYFAEGKHTDMITLAVDNDAGGRNFITSLQDKGVSLIVDIPDLPEGQEKADWNSYLQQKKQSTPETEAITSESLPLSDIQDHLSTEADLVSTIASDSSVIYTNTVNFDQAYSLNLEVHSPEEVDNLSDIKAPWTLEVTRDNHSLGYLAYGEDWGNDFNVEDELVNLDSWVTRNQVENHLYSQEEVNSFLKSLTAEKEAVGELKSYGTFIIDDDFLERRYGSEERDDNLTKAIDKAIKSITDSETYYLWHDEELDSLGASDQAFLEFHNSLQDIQYHKNGVNLFVAESSYDGATGFLSLEGKALDRDGIETYLFEKEWSPDETLDFLNNLKIAVDETWVKVIDHYNEQFDVVISRFGLSEDAKKSPENLQETMTSNSEQIKKNETILGDLSEQAQEAAPVPEVIKSQPLKELSPTQSESHSLLHFTIQKPDKSMYKRNYHIINEEDLFKLNNNAGIVQNSARWYLDNLADRTIHYFYQKEDRVYSVNLHFEERHYMHLTGIFPIKDGQTAEKTLHDFAAGRGDYDNIMISNRDATFQK